MPEAFGLARSSVSRRFIRASARELRRLQERRLDDAEWLVLVLDGKSFAGDVRPRRNPRSRGPRARVLQRVTLSKTANGEDDAIFTENLYHIADVTPVFGPVIRTDRGG